MQIAEAKPLDEVLNEIAARVRQFTNSDGAAIALREGEAVVTRASTGGIAPDVGTHMRVQGSFAGLCLTQRTLLYCEDSDTDARVDPNVCRQLNTRSIVVVPIEATHEPQGVLAVFSSVAHAFTRKDIAVLKTAADQIVRALSDAPKTPRLQIVPRPDHPESKNKPAEKLGDAPATPTVAAITQELPVKVVIEPPPTTPTPLRIGHSAPAGTTQRANVPSRAQATPELVEQRRPAPPKSITTGDEAIVPLAESIDTMPSLKEELPPGFHDQYAAWKGFENTEKPPLIPHKWLIIAGLACLALIGGLVVMQKSSSSKSRLAGVGVSAPQSSPATSPLQAVASTPPVTVETPLHPEPVPAKTAPPSVLKEKNAPVAKEPALIIDASSPKKAAPPIPETEAPQIVVTSANISLLPDVKPAVPGAPKPPRQSNLQPGELIHRVQPQFPQFVGELTKTETVVLRARVLSNGTIGDVQVLQGRPEFGRSAIAAVKQWRYRPALIDGKPVESSLNVTLNFKR